MTPLSRAGAWMLAGIVGSAAGAAPREQPATMALGVEWPSPPKPTGPIAMDHRLVGWPVVGRPLDIVITARSSASVSLALEVSAADAAALAVVAQTPGVVVDGERTWVVTVLPLLPRSSYLDVLATGDIDGVAQARSLVIPIRPDVDKAPAGAAGGGVPVTAGSENLILLPVEERP